MSLSVFVDVDPRLELSVVQATDGVAELRTLAGLVMPGLVSPRVFVVQIRADELTEGFRRVRQVRSCYPNDRCFVVTSLAVARVLDPTLRDAIGACDVILDDAEAIAPLLRAHFVDPSRSAALGKAARAIAVSVPQEFRTLSLAVVIEAPGARRVGFVAKALGWSRWTVRRRFATEMKVDPDRLVSWCQLVVAAHYRSIARCSADNAARWLNLGDSRPLRRLQGTLGFDTKSPLALEFGYLQRSFIGTVGRR